MFRAIRDTHLAMLLLGFLGCTTPEPTDLEATLSALGSLAMDQPRGSTVHLRDYLTTAEISLPDSSLPSGQDGHYQIADGWAKVKSNLWKRACPVHVPRIKNTAAPSGMQLLRGEQPLEYHFGTSKGGPLEHWEVMRGELYVTAQQSPSTWAQPPVLIHETSALLEARMNQGPSGLAPHDFPVFQATIDEETRRGLLIPAPGKVSVTVPLPEQDPVLVFGAGIAPGPVLESEAKARMMVTVEGHIIWDEIRRLGSAWTDERLSLARWAGKEATITLSSEPLGDPVRDYALFAAPTVISTPPQPPRRVVVVGLDTTRPDHLGIHGYSRNTSPGMDRFASQSVVFDQTWAPAPRTRPSFRTATTGRWPLQAINAPTIGEVLSAEGFATGGVVANVHLTPAMGFTDGFDYWRYENSASAEDQVDHALNWLQHHKSEDAFLFVHFMDPHLHYNAPAPFADQFVTDVADFPERFNRWNVYREMNRGGLSKAKKTWIKDRYDGEISYLDHELLRFFTALDALPGDTMVIVHSDHGEEFWEHGGFEHNHSLYDELVRAILWIRPPGGLKGGQRIAHPASLADIAPTIFDVVGVSNPPPSDGTSLRPFIDGATQAQRSARGAALEARPLPLGHLMFDTERWAVVHDGLKYVLHTMSGHEELYDLQKDPKEQDNLSKSRDLTPHRAKLSEATGWPVVQGWRIQMTNLRKPLVLTFAEPIDQAGVIDPEAGLQKRANLEWGEVPQTLPEDVAVVTTDKNTVTITPGPKPTGTLYVVGPTASSEASWARAHLNGPFTPDQPALGGKLVAEPGTLILVADTEAAALAESHDQDAIDALKALGYIE